MAKIIKTKVPHTCATAKVSKLEHVEDVYALEVQGARYRGATFSGVIELENGTDSIRPFKGAYRANAKLAWFGQQLKKRNPLINLAGAKITLLPSYTGDVITCLG